jgi:hypothetical protein
MDLKLIDKSIREVENENDIIGNQINSIRKLIRIENEKLVSIEIDFNLNNRQLEQYLNEIDLIRKEKGFNCFQFSFYYF